jgi:outer membrane protein
MRSLRAVLAASVLIAGGPAFAQTLGKTQSGKPARPVGPYPDRTLPTDVPDGVPHTLMDSLSIAYETNPQLTGERAHLRSVDENVPAALAGWRPQVTVQGAYGAGVGQYQQYVPAQTTRTIFGQTTTTPGFLETQKNNRTETNGSVTITQYLYRGGKTVASTHQAVNNVYAERARLIAEEETVFADTVNAYVGYIEDKQLLALDRQNEQVLGDELRAINDEFHVGELTRTDVAQAEAALAAAIATRQTAEGTLQTAAATFVRQVGVQPPNDLTDPQALKLPVKSEEEASDLAVGNNPNVIAALFNQVQLKDAIDVAFASLAPQVYLQGTETYSNSPAIAKETTYGETGTINLSFPLYQGGSEYAAIRQARQNYQQAVRQTEDARRAAKEQAVQAWDTLVAARASIASSRVAVQAAQVAVEGTEREQLVGSATVQEVLIQQQNLLSAQITLVQNVTNMVSASYGVASAIGRLTARDLGLQVPLYDETAYYNAVRDRLWGTGDYAIHQPGR